MFKTIILSHKALEMKRVKMKVITKPVNSKSNCINCGEILTGGVPVGDLRKRDDFGRPKVICLDCRNK